MIASRWARAVALCLPVVMLTATAGFAAAPVAAPATAAAGGIALVIGNATYPGLPALPACLTSAHAVSAALRRLHFSVVEQEDATAGYMDGALAQFAQQVRLADHPPTVVYSCGYASAFNDRPFLLPVSAVVNRPADLLTQAVLARSVLVAGTQANGGASLAVLDVVPLPGSPSDLGIASLVRSGLSPQLGVLAAAEDAKTELPTPVANALIAALGGPLPVTVDGVLQAVRGASGMKIIAAQAPAEPGALAAAPMPVATPAPAKLPAAKRETTPAPAPPAATAANTAAAAPPHATMPGEDQMTDVDRRQVQIALARLGYYDGKIDGVFGPDTRAAIRRWQFELHATMTGELTADEANRLVGP